VTNTIFIIILRIPDILATYFHIKLNTSESEFSYYYDIGKIIDLFDFLFTLHPFFQFILFYKFNRNFRESFQDKINSISCTSRQTNYNKLIQN
jgi:hypothetical protein